MTVASPRARSLAACPHYLRSNIATGDTSPCASTVSCVFCSRDCPKGNLRHRLHLPPLSPPQVQVAPDDPVITVNGFCADPAPAGNACKTVITRAQFEKLTEALQPGLSLPLRLKVANAYARMMRMAAAAEKRGLDQTPAFAEEIRYARMQLLSQDLTRTLQADANNLTDADLEDYYKKNESSFEQATLARIFVPRAKQTAPNADANR